MVVALAPAFRHGVMAMLSSGVRNLGKLVGGWVLAIGVTAFAMVNMEEIRTRLGLKLTPEDLGMTAPEPAAAPEVRTIIKYVERDASGGDAGRRDAARAGGRDEQLFRQSVALTRGRDGHFHADAEINGRTIGVLVDTGATLVALSYDDAMAAGVSVNSSDFRYVSSTANGQARFARVTLDQVRIGNVTVRNVPAAVSQPGKLETTLLGMSFLGQLRMEMKDGLLVLEQ
ncbi:MAG: TIGR02281 family clan AA aspartic protease [Hyphomicrobiaceae bacterium]